MGVDLELIPVDERRGEFMSYGNRLQANRNSDLWAAIKEECNPKEVRGAVYCSHCVIKEGEHAGCSIYGEAYLDSYDNPLTFVYADELAKTFERFPHTDNVAITAYLKACEADKKIVLYWG